MKSYLLIVLCLLLLVSCISCKKEEVKTKEEDEGILEVVSEYSDIELLQKVKDSLDSKNVYAKASGVTKCDMGIKIEQSSEVDYYFLNEYTYFSENSNSSLLKHHHEALFKEDNVSYFENDKKIVSLDDYLSLYGVYPKAFSFGNYDLDSSTIITSTRWAEDDTIVLQFIISPLNGTKSLKKQMKMFGGLIDYPNISSSILSLYIDKDFRLIKTISEDKYNVRKKLLIEMNVDCIQSFETVYEYDTKKTPNLDKVKTVS